MAMFAVDTNCIIAAVCAWHTRHRDATFGITQHLDQGKKLVLPAPALIEAYAVLTRLPGSYRVTPLTAWKLINENFLNHGKVVAQNATQCVELLASLSNHQIAGGRTYDWVIADCAREGGATVLLTFNSKHFNPAPEGISIIEPVA